MALTQLTNIPQSTDIVNFSARADNFLAFQLPRLVDEINAGQFDSATAVTALATANQALAASNVAGAGFWLSLSSFSTTTHTFSFGFKTFAIETGKSFQSGMYVHIKAGGNILFYAEVNSYNAITGDLTVNIQEFQGSGTYSFWLINFASQEIYPQASFVRLYNANSYGSTNTFIRRFLTQENFLNTYIDYNDSATLGASFTVKQTGVYSIHYSDQFSTADVDMGISLVAPNSNVSITSLNGVYILSAATSTLANAVVCCSFTGALSQGETVRAHTSGGASGTKNNLSQFSMAFIGKS